MLPACALSSESMESIAKMHLSVHTAASSLEHAALVGLKVTEYQQHVLPPAGRLHHCRRGSTLVLSRASRHNSCEALPERWVLPVLASGCIPQGHEPR